MTEPGRTEISPEDLDDKGLDRRGLAETLAAVNGAVEEMTERARQIGGIVVSGTSEGEQVTVGVTRAGQLTQVRLRDGVTRRYDLDALGDLIARTISETQRRARAEYDQALQGIEEPEFIVTERGLRRRPPEIPGQP